MTHRFLTLISRRFIIILSLIAVALLLPGLQLFVPRVTTSNNGQRPNILILMSDDQRFDTMEYMPRTRARIFEQGITFSNAFATTPLCCPSRASILSGMYAHRHGAIGNTYPLLKRTFVEQLHANGYYTGLVGKYLNSWDGTHRPEFDFWVSGEGSVGGYVDPRLNVNGVWTSHQGYTTYILRDYAQEFLNRAAQQDKPFMLIVTPNAPHTPADPAPGDEGLYADLPAHRPPSFDEADMSDKPRRMRNQRPLTEEEIRTIDTIRRKQLQSLHSLDRAVESILDTLAQQGKLDNTLIIYMSDNGYLWGEHRIERKNVVYEESVRIPFALRYPPLVPQPRTESRLVANIDIAPTIYDLAGLPIPPEVQGLSLLPLLRGTETWRTDLLLEGWAVPFGALHTDRYVYIENPNDRPELYDLASDPHQLQNLANDPARAQLIADFQARLAQARAPVPGEDTDYAVVYDGWEGSVDVAAFGGGYRSTSTAGQTIVYRATEPASVVALITYCGPEAGQARITIDGADKGVIDLYAATPQPQCLKEYAGLAPGRHTIAIEALGTQNSAASGAEVRVDGFRAGERAIDDSDPAVQYGAWIGDTGGAAFGSYRNTAQAGATVTFQFSGTQFAWITTRGPEAGQAQILVDGAPVAVEDLYRPDEEWRYARVVGGLSEGTHTVQIKVLDTRNQRSRGNSVIFNGFRAP